MSTTSTNETGIGVDTTSMLPLDWAGIALAAFSGVVHLYLVPKMGLKPLDVAFLLAGLGFFGAIALLVVGYHRRVLYAVGVPFVGAQLVLYSLIKRPASVAAMPNLALADKLAQVALLVVLGALLFRRS